MLTLHWLEVLVWVVLVAGALILALEYLSLWYQKICAWHQHPQMVSAPRQKGSASGEPGQMLFAGRAHLYERFLPPLGKTHRVK